MVDYVLTKDITIGCSTLLRRMYTKVLFIMYFVPYDTVLILHVII